MKGKARRETAVERSVGLSNKLDSERRKGRSKELTRRKPAKRAHREVVGAILVYSELYTKILEGKEAVSVVESLLVFPVAALNFAVVTGSIGFNELVADAKVCSSLLKECERVFLRIGETVGEFKAVVGLDTLYGDPPAFVPGHRPAEEIGGGISALLGVSIEETEAGKLIDGSVLKQAFFWVRKAFERDYLHVNLNPLPRVGHLLVGLGLVRILGLGRRKHSQLAHDPEQAFWSPGVTSLL